MIVRTCLVVSVNRIPSFSTANRNIRAKGTHMPRKVTTATVSSGPTMPRQKAIESIEKRISELEAIDAATISSLDDARLLSLSGLIRRTLKEALGDDTSEYHRYSDAASFHSSPGVISMGSDPWGGAYGTGHNRRSEQAEFIERRPHCIELLRGAIRELQDVGSDVLSSTAMPPAPLSSQRLGSGVVNINGGVNNINGNLGGFANRTGSITSSAIIDGASLPFLISELRKHQYALAGEAKSQELLQLIDNLDREASGQKPDPAKVGGILSDLRNALSGATGTLLAEGAKALIARVIG